LSTAIRPLAIEARRRCKRVAGVDFAQRGDIRIGRIEQRRKRQRRSRPRKFFSPNEGER
jgi:hypothetical protein